MPPLPEPDYYLWEHKQGSIPPSLNSDTGPHPDFQITPLFEKYALTGLIARVAELQAERDRMKNALEWVRGHISRYDPPNLPNHVAQRIDAAIAARKEQQP